MIQIQMTKTTALLCFRFEHWSIRTLDLFRISNFRYSNLVAAVRPHWVNCSGWQIKPGMTKELWTLDLSILMDKMSTSFTCSSYIQLDILPLLALNDANYFDSRCVRPPNSTT